MKNLIQTFWLITILTLLKLNSYAQVTVASNAGFSGDYVGWNSGQAFDLNIQHLGNYFINFSTGGTLLGRFTAGTLLTNGTYTGDGLRMVDPGGGPGNLDLWASTDNTTHIKFGVSGNIDGQDNQFEVSGHLNIIYLGDMGIAMCLRYS